MLCVVTQVLLHEATLRLMTGANPSLHSRYSLRCRRRRVASSLTNDDNDDDDDDDSSTLTD